MICICRSDALPAFLVEIDGLEVIGNVGILGHGDVAEVGLWGDGHNTAQVLAQLAAEPSVFGHLPHQVEFIFLHTHAQLAPDEEQVVEGVLLVRHVEGIAKLKALWPKRNTQTCFPKK